jgi:diguanylate cyclase (GGDEF)-like protein
MKSDNANLLHPEDLKLLHILKNVSREAVFDILENCPIQVLEQGDTLLKSGQTNQTMFMILSGKLNVYLENSSGDLVAKLVTGQTVGEISVIDDSPVSAHVTAVTRTRLLCVDTETFWRLIVASHEFATNLLLLLAERMRASNLTIKRSVQLKKRFERDALIDGLTRLYNRRWLDKTLQRLMFRYQKSPFPFSVIILDIDHFKKFNDAYGHSAGDEVLIHVGQTITAKMRPTDLCARYGGEEFVIILPDTNKDDAKIAAQRLRLAVGRTTICTSDGHALPNVTISLGIAQIGETDDAASALKRADAALYRAKENGRNRVECSE